MNAQSIGTTMESLPPAQALAFAATVHHGVVRRVALLIVAMGMALNIAFTPAEMAQRDAYFTSEWATMSADVGAFLAAFHVHFVSLVAFPPGQLEAAKRDCHSVIQLVAIMCRMTMNEVVDALTAEGDHAGA